MSSLSVSDNKLDTLYTFTAVISIMEKDSWVVLKLVGEYVVLEDKHDWCFIKVLRNLSPFSSFPYSYLH